MKNQSVEGFEVYGSVASFTLFEELFVKEEKKVQPPIISPEHLNLCSQKKIKRKGRPKTHNIELHKPLKTKGEESDKDKQKGHWSEEERKKYHLFLEIHHRHFIQREMRRVDKIFKSMANFMGTREAEQCRSHHQKMEKKHHTFPNILLYLRKNHYGSEPEYNLSEQLTRMLGQNPKILTSEELQALNKVQRSQRVTQKLPEVKIELQLKSEAQGPIQEIEQISFDRLLEGAENNYEFNMQFL